MIVAFLTAGATNGAPPPLRSAGAKETPPKEREKNRQQNHPESPAARPRNPRTGQPLFRADHSAVAGPGEHHLLPADGYVPPQAGWRERQLSPPFRVGHRARHGGARAH